MDELTTAGVDPDVMRALRAAERDEIARASALVSGH